MRELFGHPFSSYTWKALIAFYESDTPFDYRVIAPDQPENVAALAVAWPLGKFPVLIEREGDRAEVLIESSVIVEHVAPHLIPADRALALETRMLDRIFDLHVMTPVQTIVSEHLPHLTPEPDAARIARAKEALFTIYGWLDAHLAGRPWAAGDAFTLADCAAAPALFYADWVAPIPEEHATLRAYRARTLARPSVKRCVDDARPYRAYFPPGAPDRD